MIRSTNLRPATPASTSSQPVLVVDDHPLIRLGLRTLINSEADLCVCGEAAGLSQAMAEYRDTHPRLVIADVMLENGSGIDLTKELTAHDPGALVLIYSMHDESLYAERALRAGAKGYVAKDAPIEYVLTAIRRILQGRVYLSEAMTDRMLSRSVGLNGNGAHESPIESLSDRELEVFEELGHGVTTRQIAGKLHLSPKTIETYRENIKLKLNLRNATELTQHAVQWVLEGA